MKSWKRIDPTIRTKIDWREMVVKNFELPDGKTTTRATMGGENSRSAGVIALTKDRKVIVARQFRAGPERMMDEIPGGGVDVDEDPESAARRELLEETGYTAGAMTFLGQFSRDAYVNGKWYYYVATDCELTHDQNLDHDEFVSIKLCSIAEFIESAKQGNMTDPAAVLAAYEQLRELQNKEEE